MHKPDKDEIAYELPAYISAMEKRRATLYNTGDWYSVTNSHFAAHYFISAREDSDLAISLCASVVEPIDKLHVPAQGQRCLTCALYAEVGKGGDYEERMKRKRDHAERVRKLHERREQQKQQKDQTITQGEF